MFFLNLNQADRRNRCNQVLLLAYQSFGLVFGDLSISPLYVYKCTFYGGLRHHQTEDTIFGAFSLIFWTITLLSLVKYMVFVLSADDNGEGMLVFANWILQITCKLLSFSVLQEGSLLCTLCSAGTRDSLCFRTSKRLMKKSPPTMALVMLLETCLALLSKAL